MSNVSGNRARITADQIKGTLGQTLYDDIRILIETAVDKPVSNKKHLPRTNNTLGDVRLVIDESRFYEWTADKRWMPLKDYRTEQRIVEITIPADEDNVFVTNIPYGVINGALNTDCVSVLVNGVLQVKNTDYRVNVSGTTPRMLVISWISPDFQLETTDILQVSYSMLRYDALTQ